jgi:putative two-component system response regulator
VTTDTRPTVLAVDDTPANLSLLSGMLRDQYRVKLATSGAKALDLAGAQVPDLILLDIMMPEMDGYEVCRRLKANPLTRNVPVIFLTARTEVEDEEQGFAVGAVDFIHKPISPPIVLARVSTHLQMKQWQDYLHNQNAWLEAQVEHRLGELQRMQGASIYIMVSLAEFRDDNTGRHIVRTQKYTQLLANALHERRLYTPLLTADLVDRIARTAPLHDIGKIAIPDNILLKPGKLDDAEFSIMKSHAERGYDILTRCAQSMGETGEFLRVAMQIARSHHERWDGAGYPDRLAGTDIPLPARVMAVADVYDALRTRRPYKEPMSHEAASRILRDGSGKHFDPVLIDTWFELGGAIERIAADWPDE